MTDDLPPVVSPPRAEGSGEAPVQVRASGLSRREHEMLTFERQWWRQAGAKETAIRDRFGVTPTGRTRWPWTRCSSVGSGGCDSRDSERVRPKVLGNESDNG